MLEAAAVGFLAAILIVANGTVRPKHAGVIAAIGFVACWAGIWLQNWSTKRARNRAQRDAWNEIDRRYSLVMDAAGLSSAYPGYLSRRAWWRVHKAEVFNGAVLFSSDIGTYLILPVRCLPPEWPATILVPHVNARIREAGKVNV